MKYRFHLTFWIVLAGLLLSTAEAQESYTIGMSQCNLGEPWRQQMNADIKKAADAHSNLTVIFKDAQNDSLIQRSHVEEFVSQGVDLIIISPREAAPLTKPVAEAFEQGVPVIVLDRAVLGEQVHLLYRSGQQRDRSGCGGVDRKDPRWQGQDRRAQRTDDLDARSGPSHWISCEGVDLENNPGLEIVFDADMQWLEPNARREMESALSRFDDIDLVYAHNDPGAHGAYLAARAAGREKDILFVGIDALPHEGLMYVKQGILDVTFEYPTGGAEAIDIALKILKGETVEKNIVLGTRVFTKENVERGGEAVQ